MSQEQETTTTEPQKVSIGSGLYFVEEVENKEGGYSLHLKPLNFSSAHAPEQPRKPALEPPKCGCKTHDKGEQQQAIFSSLLEVIGLVVFVWMLIFVLADILLPALFGSKKA